MDPLSLDHVALWTDQRQPLSDFLCGHLGMHEIERTDSFTLCGVDAKLGKLTLFDAEGPRERGLLEHVALRVPDVPAAAADLPGEVEQAGGAAVLEAPGGLRLALVPGEGRPYDLDHVVLRVPDPDSSATALAELGFERRDGRLEVADRHVRLVQGDPGPSERPLLNHLALLVESAEAHRVEAEERGIPVEDVKDAPNTLAVFLRGPDEVRVEYVEHKPGFALV